MNLLEKSDQEIIDIANPIWQNLVKSSNIKDYGGFTKDFSSQMLFGANEVELGKQWANNKLLTSLSDKKEVFGCLRRDLYVTVLYKQTSNTVSGEFLGRLVLGVEDDGNVVIVGGKKQSSGDDGDVILGISASVHGYLRANCRVHEGQSDQRGQSGRTGG